MHGFSFSWHFIERRNPRTGFCVTKTTTFSLPGRWSLDSSRCAVDSQVPLAGREGVWHFQWQKLGFGRLGSPQLWDHTISLYVFGRLTNPGYRPLINWHDPPRTPIQVSLISTILECEFKILVHASKCWFQTCSTCNTLQETNSQPPSSARVFESMLMWDMLLSGDI